MNNIRSIFLRTAIIVTMPVLAYAAPQDGSDNPPPPPPPPHADCTYQHHTCMVQLPDVNFVVSKVNDITPSSDNDCKLLPLCSQHVPPPPPRKGDGNPPPPPPGDKQ